MKKLTTTLFSLILLFNLSAQSDKSYIDKKGNKQLCGSFTLEDLSSDSTYNSWYTENYEKFKPELKDQTWSENLKNKQVDIYIGTWCGDSKTWLPRFIKIWDELNLDREQLNFIALYNGDEKYKQGPNGEEVGKQIHRVPTFIFKADEKEVARIVEYPKNSLETDLAQIALGYPSSPNYGAANYLLDLFETTPLDTIYTNYRLHLNKVYKQLGKSSELNTLGYVLMRSNRLKEAALVFQMNTLCFRYNPNVYDSYGEILAAMDATEEAIKQYEKVLAIDPENENAKEQLAILKAKE